MKAARRKSKPVAKLPSKPRPKPGPKTGIEPRAGSRAGAGSAERPAAVRERLREQQRATYREAILDAAERVFATRGFTGVRMSDVAAEAGMATGTLYNYFENKGEILGSLMLARGNGLLRELEATLEAERDALARIARIVQAILEYVEKHRAGYKMLVETASTELAVRRCAGPGMQEIQVRYLALFEAAMAAALRARRLRSKFPARDLAIFLAGAIDGLARTSISLDDRVRLADKVGMVMELFLSGAGTKS